MCIFDWFRVATAREIGYALEPIPNKIHIFKEKGAS